MTSFDPFADGSASPVAAPNAFDPFSSGLAQESTSAGQGAGPSVAVEDLFKGADQISDALPKDAREQLDAAAKDEADPAGFKMRAANTAFLADRLGKPVGEVSANYEMLRDHYASVAWHEVQPLDDAKFYGTVGVKLNREREEHGMLGQMQAGLFSALRNGETFQQAYEEQRKQFIGTPGWHAFKADAYRELSQKQWDVFTEAHERLAGVIGPVADYMLAAQKAQSAKSLSEVIPMREARTRALSLLAQLPDNEAQMVMDFAATQAAPQGQANAAKKGMIEKTASAVERGTMDFLQEGVGAVQEVGRRVFESPQDAATARRSAQLARQMDQRIRGEVDPLKGGGWLANETLKVAEGMPRFISALSIPGIVANYAATKEELRGAYEDQGVPAGKADLMSAIAALPQTALNFVSSKMALGTLPGGASLLGPITKPGFAPIAKQVGKYLVAESLTQPILQGAAQLAPPAVQSIAHRFDAAVPDTPGGFIKQAELVAKATPETFISLIPFILLGAGVGTFHDRAAGKVYLQNKARLTAVGLSDEAAGKIMEAPTPEKAVVELQKAWEERRASAEQQAAVQALDAQAAEARAKHGVTLPPDETTPTPTPPTPAEATPTTTETTAAADATPSTETTQGATTATATTTPEEGLTVMRAPDDTYTVSKYDGSIVGKAATAEGAARIVQDHTQAQAAERAAEQPPGTVRLTKEEVANVRERLGLSELPEAQRQTFEETLAKAKESGLAAHAEGLADEINAKPRVITPVEHAAFVLRAAELHSQYERLQAQAADQFDQGNVHKGEELRGMAENVLGAIDRLTTASDHAGSEAGRALSVRRMGINQKTYQLADLVQRATLAKKSGLSHAETESLRTLAASIKEQQVKIDALEKELVAAKAAGEEANAHTFVAEGRRRRSAVSKEANVRRRIDLKKQLLDLGLRVNDITSSVGQGAEVASIVAKLARTYIEDGATTLHEVAAQLKGDIPDLTDQDIFNTLGGKIQAEQKKIQAEAEQRIVELKKQAGLWADIYDRANGLDKAGASPAKSSEEIAVLRQLLAELRLQANGAIHDDKLLAAIHEKINAVQDQLTGGFRAVPEKVTEAQRNEKVDAARATLAKIREEMGLTDTASHLREALRTGDLPQKEPATAAPPDSLAGLREEVANLREELRKRQAPGQDEVNARRMEGLQKTLDAVTAQMEGGFRNVPGESQALPDTPEVAAVRQQIADVRARIQAQDAVYALEEQLRTGERAAREHPSKEADAKVAELRKRQSDLRQQIALTDKIAHIEELLTTGQKETKPGEKPEEANARIKELNDRLAELKQVLSARDHPPVPLEERTAQQELERLAKVHSDVQAWPTEKENAVRDAIAAQKQEPVSIEDFQKTLEGLGVKTETAAALAQVMETDARARAEIARAQTLTPEEINAERKAKLETRFADLSAQIEGGFRHVPEAKKEGTPETVDVVALKQKVRELASLMRNEDAIHDLEEQMRTGDYKISAPEKRVVQNAQLQEALIKRQQLQREVKHQIEALKPKTALDRVVDVATLPRSILATADMSATLRQALFLSARRPFVAAKTFGQAVRAFFSQNKADAIDLAIRRHPNQIERQKAGLYLSNLDHTPATREEDFASNLATRIPLFGHVVNASERNMVTTLNLIRTATFDQFIHDHPEATPEQRKAYAAYVNAASGRGDLGRFNQASKNLSAIFFAPRYAVSRFQLLYSPFKNVRDPLVRNEIAKDFLAFATTGVTVLGLAAMAGAKVGLDPEKPDFGKIVIGNTHIDIWGGLQQPVRLIMQPILAGLDRVGLHHSEKPINLLDVGGRYLAYKLAPSVTIPYSLLSGKNVIGEDQTITQTLVGSISPLIAQDAYSLFDENESKTLAAAATAATFFGMGVQQQTPKDKTKRRAPPHHRARE